MKPFEIEEKSFQIIKNEVDLEYFNLIPDDMKPVVIRVIHATADFDFLYNLKWSEDFFERSINALKNGCTILTDVEMIKAGISKNLCNKFGVKINCYMSAEDVINYAKENGITRARASILLHGEEANDGIIVVGNAPTALFTTMELIEKSKIKPTSIVGVPVGFVGAEESKNELYKKNLTYITSLGRKGGTPVAVAIINALLRLIPA